MLEIISAVMGVSGSFLLAIKSPYAGWAFVLYLFSNIGWVIFGVWYEHWALVVQNLIFGMLSIIGIWVWLIRPRLGLNEKLKHIK